MSLKSVSGSLPRPVGACPCPAMFKKATAVNQQQLRGDLVKRLKKDLQLQLDLSEDDVDAAFPAKADVLLVKMSNRAVVYTTGGQPLVFDPVRGEAVPGAWRARASVAAPRPCPVLPVDTLSPCRKARTTCTPPSTCCGACRRR